MLILKTLAIVLISTQLYATTIMRTQVIMGTTATISLEKIYKSEIYHGFRILKDVEDVLSTYDHHAKIYKLNQHKTIPIDEMVVDILQKSSVYHDRSEGYFDVSIGSVTKDMYRFGMDERLPDREALKRAVVNMDGVYIDCDNIRLDKGVKLDFGGIGKGYGVDHVVRYYHDRGIKRGKVALSGDIRCLDRCDFSIQNPFQKEGFLATYRAKVANLSISTSGTYERYVKSQKHHHLINPKNKKQGRAFVSVTILCKADNTKADALATAASVMPKDEAIRMLLKEEVGFILVEPDGTILSSQLEKFVSQIKGD